MIVPELRASPTEVVSGGLRWMTVPNALSLVRLAMLAPILYYLDQPGAESDLIAALIFVAAMATDLLDGFLARSRGWMSPTGKVVDPLADKGLLGGIVLYLAAARDFPLWLVAALFFRDAALIIGGLLFFRRDRIVFGANWSGKLATFTLGALVLAHILWWPAWYPPLIVAAAVFLGLSYLSYGHRAYAHTRSRGAAPLR
ncbi:MAG: CDP-alcohol phosphatidyltransferase family protein [Gemmatimonadota bacterium]